MNEWSRLILAVTVVTVTAIPAYGQTTDQCATPAPTEMTTPADTPVAAGFCTKPSNSWTKVTSHHYILLVDGAQQPWAGPLTGVVQPGGDTFWSLPLPAPTGAVPLKFSAGKHTLEFKLINHCLNAQECPTNPLVTYPFDSPASDPNIPPLTVTATTTTGAVDCVVSAWSVWSVWSAWTPINATTEQRTQTRTRTVTTPASGGGAACPTLTETNTETRPITTANACTPVTGAEALSIFVTRYDPAPARAGQLMRVNFQLASKSPVTELTIKLNGVVMITVPSYTADGGTWFKAPARGTYKLQVSGKNAFGCPREVFGPTDVSVR